jgi:GTPase SAR1 family protein
MNNSEITKKIMIVGESNTGKTSLVSYLFNNGQFSEKHNPTVGVEVGIKAH